jgi:hypothetical protein
MLIWIPIDDISEDIRYPLGTGLVKNCCIDYATNCIHGYIGSEEIVIFNFGDYFWNSNKFNNYAMSVGLSGITINLKSTR